MSLASRPSGTKSGDRTLRLSKRSSRWHAHAGYNAALIHRSPVSDGTACGAHAAVRADSRHLSFIRVTSGHPERYDHECDEHEPEDDAEDARVIRRGGHCAPDWRGARDRAGDPNTLSTTSAAMTIAP